MKLNDPLIADYEINGKELEFDLSFDNVLDVLEVLNSSEFDVYNKINIMIELLVTTEVELTLEEKTEVYDYLVETYIQPSRDEFILTDRFGNEIPEVKKKVIDFEKDAEFIFSSFFSIGINLFEQQGKLTWMEFQALMSSLPDDSIMSRIVSIREWEESKDDTKEQKERMRKLKLKYSLEDREEVDDG